jgi:hypothetical protein
VQEPCKGCCVPSAGLPVGRMRPSRDRSTLRGAAGRRPQGSRPESAWEELGRNPGPGFGRQTLGGQNPREQPVCGSLTLTRRPGTPGRVKAQKPRPVGPAQPDLSDRDHRRDKRYVGATGVETRRQPSVRRKLQRVNPKSAAGVKQNRQGLGGSKAPRG